MKKKYRILMLCCQEIGAKTGSGVVALELTQRLAARGHKVTLLYGSNSGVLDNSLKVSANIQVDQVIFNTESPNGLPFPVVGMSNEMPYLSMKFSMLKGEELDRYIETWSQFIKHEIKENFPDIIHIHHLWLLAYIVEKIAPQIPTVISLHGTELHRAADSPHIRDLIQPSFKKVCRFFSLSKRMIQDANNIFRLDQGKFVVLGNGFSRELFYPVQKMWKDDPFYNGIPKSVPIITFVGKFARWKGLNYLINAFSQIIHDSPAHLIVGGSGPDHIKKEYVQQVCNLKIENRVHFLGHLQQNKVAELLNASHVFVLPSFHEPFGLILLEAIACGCRIVSTNQGGPSEFLPESLIKLKDAILIPGLNNLKPTKEEAVVFENSLMDATLFHLKQSLSLNDRKRISASVQNFSWEYYLDKLIDEYDYCIKL